MYSKKMLGCFNPNLGQIWTNPSVRLKCNKKIPLKVKVEVFECHFNPTFGFVHI